MKKFFLFICLFFTYQCEDLVPFLQEDVLQEDVVLGCPNQDALNYNAVATEDDGSCTNTDLSISFNSTEPTYLMPGSDLIVNYSIWNPSDNEIPSKLLWVDLMYDSSGTKLFIPAGFYSYLYNEEYTVQPGITNLTDTLVFDEVPIPTNSFDYFLYLDIKYNADTDGSNNFQYIPIEAHIGETVFIDHFNTTDKPLGNYSEQWGEYSSANFVEIKISDERLEIQSSDTTAINSLWDYVLIDTKITEKIEFDANLGFVSLNSNEEDTYYGIFLADWNKNLAYYLLLNVSANGNLEAAIRIYNYNDDDDGYNIGWDSNPNNIGVSDLDISSNKFELEYDSGKNYLYGYIDGYEIAKLPLYDFECQGYGIMVTSGTTIWADDVGVYGNEVASELDLGRVSRSSRISGFPNRKIHN